MEILIGMVLMLYSLPAMAAALIVHCYLCLKENNRRWLIVPLIYLSVPTIYFLTALISALANGTHDLRLGLSCNPVFILLLMYTCLILALCFAVSQGCRIYLKRRKEKDGRAEAEKIDIKDI